MANVNNFYLIYHSWQGEVYAQICHGDVTVGGKPMETLAKIKITEDEFYKMSIRELRAKYPYSG